MPASFVKPDGCVRFVQFPFDVVVCVYVCSLFGVYKLDVHGSVHRNINLIERTNKMQPCSRIYYSNVS